MRLIIITPSKDLPDEPAMVTKMFESGLQTLHLRKPRQTTNQMRAYLREIPVHFHNRIVIHSHHNLALRFNLRGVHFSRSHLAKKWKYAFTRFRLRMKYGGLTKSRSYSRLQQVYNPEAETYTYYFLGTVFNNMTGELYSGYYEEGVVAANKNCGKKLIARGGTAPRVIERAKQFGFYGIAFNSYIWNAEAPFEHFRHIIAEFKKLGIEIE
jgi:thiamine-phosphate pyrophosphorylase